jgi:DNA-binding NarL/FixJ family response regulator
VVAAAGMSMKSSIPPREQPLQVASTNQQPKSSRLQKIMSAIESSPPTPPATRPVAPKRILIVDDHPVFRRGIGALVGEQADLAVCGEAEGAPSALEAMRQLKPDLALLDISMPGTNGIELIKLMLAEQPKLLILILSMHDESLYALRALRAGAKGYVMKAEAMNYVIAAIRKVLNHEIYVSPRFSERLVFRAVQSLEGGMGSPVDKLSDRELEVLQLLGKGSGTREIANNLHLSVKTIETHRAHIKEKLGFKDAGEMVRFAIDWVAQEQG